MTRDRLKVESNKILASCNTLDGDGQSLKQERHLINITQPAYQETNKSKRKH